MIGDRNTFRPENDHRAVRARALETDADARQLDRAALDIRTRAIVAQIDDVTDAIERRRNALVAEVVALEIGEGAATALGGLTAAIAGVSIGEVRARINAARTMLSSLENAVGSIFRAVDALENLPVPDRPGRAANILESAERILEAAGGFSPSVQLADDQQQTIDDVKRDTERIFARGAIVSAGLIVAALVIVITIQLAK
jgi:hypothetical protein